MPLFNIPTRPDKSADMNIVKKSTTSKKSATSIKGSGGLADRINTARVLVDKHLGHLKDEYIVIRDEVLLHDYISACLKHNVISIDTETTGLDPLQDELVGICIYTTGEKGAYIPVNHKSYITMAKAENQLSKDILHREFQRVVDSKIDIIMFNACFDTRFLRSGIDVSVHCTWDCYLGARLLNENEGAGNNGLKKLHQKYVLDGQGSASKFSDLFDGISFDLVPINLGYIYAANDAKITYELYEFQKPFLTETDSECVNRGLTQVAWVFHNIEMPCVDVVADMEDTGVKFDFAKCEELQSKYTAILDEKYKAVYSIVDTYKDKIAEYTTRHINNKLSNPINIDSPTQIAILLYDILNTPVVDTATPRGTGEAVLKKIDTDFTRALLDYRGIKKLMTTYIEKLPNCVNKKDGRIHCKFNQYGADTGRFSSNEPNLQNIPSHNHDIRQMFVSSNDYVLMSSDYSQQEPKCLAALCMEQGDSQMYDTFVQGKDLYSEIASKAFNKSYEECCEFDKDGNKNPAEYKVRRTQAKSILLGVLYGRGTTSVAEQLGCSVEEATKIKESVFRGFPAIKKFEQASIKMAQDYGYVTTVCGRKRRLPSMMLPDYEIVWKDGVSPNSDPLAMLDDNFVADTEVPDNIQRKWINKIKSVPFKDKHKIMELALNDGIKIIDHTREKDVTKVVNARIQGSAADLTKLAMIELHEDKRLQELGFRILIPVHDEVIAECPIVNAKECSTLLAQIMSNTAEQILKMPIKCDVEISKRWYGESIDL